MAIKNTNLPCPDCGGASKRSGRREGSGVQRYTCLGKVPATRCQKKPRRFTELSQEVRRDGEDPEPVPTRESLRDDTHVFLITYAQNATKVHPGFWQALNACKQDRDADLICIQGRYRNPTSRREAAKQEESDEWWVEEVVPYLWNKRENLCDTLTILGDIRVRPTAERPLTSLHGFTGPRSGILGHPKLAMRVVATPHQSHPKQMLTTGACTVHNYSDSKSGKKGDFHHTIGALIVEIRGDEFHVRQLNAVRDGSFIDLDKEYTARGEVKKAPRALAMKMGDWHSGFTCPKVIDATFGGHDSIVGVLKPEKIFWEDVLDQYARNHHHRDNPFIAIAKSRSGRGCLMEEVTKACNDVSFFTGLAEKLCDGPVESIITASNHDEALTRYIKEGSWKNDPENAEFYLETALIMARETKMAESGAQTPQAFHIWARNLLRPGVRLLHRNESYMVGDIEHGMHGDVGLNGSRGNINSLSQIGVKSVIAHAHTPGIHDGCYQVGTSTILNLEYTTGPSSWMNTHAVTYGNGKRVLITIVNGKWRHE